MTRVWLVNWKTRITQPYEKWVAEDFVKWNAERGYEKHEGIVSMIYGDFANPLYYLTETFRQIGYFGFHWNPEYLSDSSDMKYCEKIE